MTGGSIWFSGLRNAAGALCFSSASPIGIAAHADDPELAGELEMLDELIAIHPGVRIVL